MKLSESQLGARLRVLGFQQENAYSAQLMRLGLVPGTIIEIVRFAPLGDPIEIRLRGFSLALRPEEASAMNVQLMT